MSWDLNASLKRALVKQQWVFGKKYFRLGNPFTWVDGSIQLSSYDYRGIVDLAQWYSGYYEEYQTPSGIKTKHYDAELSTIEEIYRDIFDSYFPFIDENTFDARLYIRCHALARMQDYCIIHKFAPDLLPRKRKTNSLEMDISSIVELVQVVLIVKVMVDLETLTLYQSLLPTINYCFTM